MINKFVKAWDIGKENLQEFFKTNKQKEYDTYEKIVQQLVRIVINPYIRETQYDDGVWNELNIEDMVVLDHGDYQGMQLFIFHADTYQPGVEDYYYTHNYYGSCSGCDTLLSILEWDDEALPTDSQVEEYMSLCLHLLQRFNKFKEED
ncbi:MAG: hypothetical protein J6J36_02870 [Clostridia bacterium]|nr:hypothetical protein [Clostridia bacterium]